MFSKLEKGNYGFVVVVLILKRIQGYLINVYNADVIGC